VEKAELRRLKQSENTSLGNRDLQDGSAENELASAANVETCINVSPQRPGAAYTLTRFVSVNAWSRQLLGVKWFSKVRNRFWWSESCATRARILAAEVAKAEYDRGLWRYRLLSPLRGANSEIPIGGFPFRPLPLSLLNSNCGSGNCSSRQGRIPLRVSSAPGASETGIGAMSQNGYLRNGASP
jgi:hypothetical protein